MSEANLLCNSFYFSNELIVEILKRLPVKSLLRFMSVCKSWYSLIKNPNFKSTHLNYQIELNNSVDGHKSWYSLIKNPNFKSTHLNYQIELNNSVDGPKYILYYEFGSEGRYILHLDNNEFSRHMDLIFQPLSTFLNVGSCDGLFIFCVCYDSLVTLWNPSLRKCIDLVVPRCYANCMYFHGIGFDSAINEYKVVVGVYSMMGSEIWTRIVGFSVYLINECVWRCVDVSFQLRGECVVLDKEVHVNGVIYWLIQRVCDDCDTLDSILMFNVTDETFFETPLPRDMVEKVGMFDDVDLMVLKRRGVEVFAVLHSCEAFLDYWVLEDTDQVKSWRRILSVNCFDGYRRFINERWNGEVLVKLEDGRVISVSHGKMTVKHICDLDLLYLGPYIENLVLLRIG